MSSLSDHSPSHAVIRTGRRFNVKLAREIAVALRTARQRDALGHHIATLLAMIYLFLLPLATGPKEWAFGVLAVWTAIRVPHTWRTYGAQVFLPVTYAAIAWLGWQGLSFLWSDDVRQGLEELKVQRLIFVPLLLWPLLDRLPWLVMATLAGVLAQNGVQVMQELGWIEVPAGGEGRLRGLIHPIHSGMWFTAALLWHLSAIANTRGVFRWTSAALACAAFAGLLATGSRGPWIACAVALPMMLVIVAVRRPSTRPAMLSIAAVVIAAVAGTMVLAPTMVRERLHEAQQEIVDAHEHQKYWTSTGLRLALWGWAWELWRTSPVIGIGAGDFSKAYPELASFKSAAEHAREQALIEEVPGYAETRAAGGDVTALRGYRRGERAAANRIDYLLRAHAHSTYLHTLVQQGLIGLALLVIMLGCIARQCWRDRRDHPYSDAMLFVLVCWMVGAQFDCYELNGHQLALLALLAVFTMPLRARVRWWPATAGRRA